MLRSQRQIEHDRPDRYGESKLFVSADVRPVC